MTCKGEVLPFGQDWQGNRLPVARSGRVDFVTGGAAATLANREMQVNTSIDEADVGGIREKQRVLFSVDASPEGLRRRVMQARKSAQVVQNCPA